jgi:hypothetical protein
MITIYVNFSKEEVLNEQQFEELKEKTIPLFEEDMDGLDDWLTSDYSAAEILCFSESQKTELLKEWKKTCVNYVYDYLYDEGWQKIPLEI